MTSPGARAAGLAVLVLALGAAARLALAGARAPVRRRVRPAPMERGAFLGVAGLCASVLADSAVEHARGSYSNPGMYTPLLVSTLGLAAATRAVRGTATPRPSRATFATVALTGLAGIAFHAANVLRRPGRIDWQNVFYGAPLGAPGALAIAGGLGLAARRSRLLRALAAAGLAGASGEAALLHFRGSFQDPFMWLPVSVPPAAAALTAAAAVRTPTGFRARLTRAMLRLTAFLGVAGMGFHAYGVARCMGGWRNWSQNVVAGPPLAAPPSFTALAIAGLAALGGGHG